MSPSKNSIEFGYTDFHKRYVSNPFCRGLLELSKVPLAHPSAFSAVDPNNVCLAAMHGHMLYPIDERSLKVRVGDDAPYSKTISARVASFKKQLTEFNAQPKPVFFTFEIVIDDTPFTLEEFQFYGLGEHDIARAALEFEIDRKYHSLGHAGRLNHFAQHYGFHNFIQLKAFVERLDIEAQMMGFPSYGTLCTSTRYMNHLMEKHKGQASMAPALAALMGKWDLLEKESVFIISQFMECRTTDAKVPYRVDVSADGVLIELREGMFKGTGIVSSEFMSDQNRHFHDMWFQESNHA